MDNKKKMKAMIKQMQSVIALVIIFVVASTICIKDGRNNFLDIRNLMNVLRAVSENGIIAIGMTIILILGDIDLSVGSVVGLISTGCAYLMVKSGLGFVPAILVSLGIGALFGLFNGLCITKLRLDLFLALNDPMAEGAYIAAKNAGKEGDILFVGFDGLPTPDGGIRSVMDGRLSMTQVYPTGGTEAIESAYQLLVEGKELDKTLTLTSEIVVPDNAEELLAKYGGSAE